jgi:hypothetical protein
MEARAQLGIQLRAEAAMLEKTVKVKEAREEKAQQAAAIQDGVLRARSALSSPRQHPSRCGPDEPTRVQEEWDGGATTSTDFDQQVEVEAGPTKSELVATLCQGLLLTQGSPAEATLALKYLQAGIMRVLASPLTARELQIELPGTVDGISRCPGIVDVIQGAGFTYGEDKARWISHGGLDLLQVFHPNLNMHCSGRLP